MKKILILPILIALASCSWQNVSLEDTSDSVSEDAPIQAPDDSKQPTI